MTEEVKMLLRALLAEAEETEAGQQTPYIKKTNKEKLAEEPKQKQTKSKSKAKPQKDSDTMEDFRRSDLAIARSEMYAQHENNSAEPKNVPTWAKYALTLPEAADYFHLGYNKLRELVRKDKYADYLLWNGGRVYIKRRLFEEFLDKETEV